MNEIKINLDNLNAEERETLMKLVEKGNKPKSKVWKPTSIDAHWFVAATGEVYCNREVIEPPNAFDRRYEMGNCFPTAEEAEEEATRRKMLTRWKRLSIEAGEDKNPWDGFHEHWGVTYEREKLNTRYTLGWHDMNMFFPSRGLLLDAIAELGEENVKRYILGVKQ